MLTTEERKKLLTNFKGYDISPDMVRLSLVNMYLHGFVQPQIMEYDTLTSEERWNEYADVILANPPFMTPKGGIKPHKKFSVQSNRSEVLFVDYIAEHLTPTGRAAVIVPEGIIFQGAGAYKQLRKMLVENHLYAVVSLPAGIFNPYSGVKTSILLMDRQIAKKCDSILFIKIENDGFGLGAQRREQTGSDLPDAVNVISDYVKAARSGVLETFIPEEKPCGALLVTKEKLAENEEYNLTGDRYRNTISRAHQKWPWVELGDVINFFRGVTYSKEDESDNENSKIVLRANNIDLSTGKIVFSDLKKVSGRLEFKDSQLLKKSDILICTASGSADHIGKVGFSYEDYPYYFGGFMGVIRSQSTIDPYYLYMQLKNEQFRKFLVETSVGANIRNLNYSTFSTYKIPLPPLEVQREIVTEIEGYQKLIDGARQVVDSWKPQINIDPEWPMVKLGDYVSINNGYVLTEFDDEGSIACIKVSDMNLEENQNQIVTSSHWIITTEKKLLPNDSIIFPKRGAAIATNKKRITKIPCLIDNNCMAITVLNSEQLDPMFLYSFMLGFDLNTISNSAGIALINNPDISGVEIPLPSYNIQQEIVTKIEAERKVIDGCRELIKTYEDKIKRVIDKVWEE
ncbi:MAG: N-6 DNA methylase [Candidatus Methanofastidiosa archaeon]|nr:N-6 DNA methylase [Candidatus Methanofastidiosa archaeon]